MPYNGHKSFESFKIYLHPTEQGRIPANERMSVVGGFLGDSCRNREKAGKLREQLLPLLSLEKKRKFAAQRSGIESGNYYSPWDRSETLHEGVRAFKEEQRSIRADLARLASTSHAAAQGQNPTVVAAIVKAQKANLRYKPSRSASVVTTVNKDNLLSLISKIPTGAWYQVRETRTGSQGWIHGNTIALLQTSESTSASATQTPPTQRSRLSLPVVSGKSYVNVDGVRVPSPVFSGTKPAGATARCRDGSYSFSQHRQGTCSHHGGVAEWL